MLSMIRRMFYRMPQPRLAISVREDIAGCEHCVRLLHNRYALSFITHAVDHHCMDHDAAVEVLERLHRVLSKSVL